MIDPDRIYHVYPVKDLREHDMEVVYTAIGYPYCNCECKPTYDYEEGKNFIIVHNSFDGRENFEPNSFVRNN